jgi:hypothetical protein
VKVSASSAIASSSIGTVNVFDMSPAKKLTVAPALS